jgi:hypothetical protein
MLGFLIDNIFVVFNNQTFQQAVGIPMGTYCAPFLADLFLSSYEAQGIKKLLYEKNKYVVVHLNISTKFYRSTKTSSYFACFIKHRCLRKTNNSIAWQTGWFQFCHCQLPIYIKQHPTITCIWCKFLSDNSIWKSLL